ncbi:hypothetical protein Gohar_020091, partial [Gossypium harknessii]|nr:hypothetical protein [Gossypium harknessii]
SQPQPQNNEQPKLQGGSALPNLQQQGIRNIQTAQALNFSHQSLMTGAAMSDEFKFGFPSDGLSVITNKWWGSSKSDCNEVSDADGAETEGEDKHQTIEEPDYMANDKPDQNGKIGDGISPQGSSLLAAIRKRSMEEGREALELGVYKGRGMKRLDSSSFKSDEEKTSLDQKEDINVTSNQSDEEKTSTNQDIKVTSYQFDEEKTSTDQDEDIKVISHNSDEENTSSEDENINISEPMDTEPTDPYEKDK